MRQALYWAVCWTGTAPAPGRVLSQPSIARYIAGWKRPTDAGVIAEIRGVPVGAASYRPHPAHAPGYGFVRLDVPEVGLAVFPGYRGRGIGRRLLQALIETAERDGLPGLSLSVANANVHARRLYQRAGFRPVGGSGGSTTMLLRLPRPGAR